MKKSLILVIAFLVLKISFYVEIRNQQPNSKILEPAQAKELVEETEEATESASKVQPYVEDSETKKVEEEHRSGVSKEEINRYVDEIFITESGNSWARRIINCESKHNIYAWNPSGASGLFQFIPNTYYGNKGTDLYDWKEQVRVAKSMYDAGQQYQWVCK